MFLTSAAQEIIVNGQASGEVGSQMMQCRFDPGYLRPFVGSDGHKYVTINTGQRRYDETLKREVPVMATKSVAELMMNGMHHPVHNATLGLRKDEWLFMDQVIIDVARQRLRAWSDLAAANSYGGFNAMAKMVLEHEAVGDSGSAVVDMDGLAEGRDDTPENKLYGTPLPITHSDFWLSSRRLAISREAGTPLDMTKAERAGRRVAETIEKTTIGTITGMKYGTESAYERDSRVYGYTNFPDRVTKTGLTAPTNSNGTTIVGEILEMIELLYGQNHYGPYMLYVSTGYDQFLDNDLKANSDKTVRQRIREIDQIRDVRRLDYLTGNVMILVQMTSDVARAIDGMGITTIQWDTDGGMRTNFKVMAIQVPQLRSDANGNCGICHGTV